MVCTSGSYQMGQPHNWCLVLPSAKSTQYTNTKVDTSTQYFGNERKFDGNKCWVITKYFQNKGKYCSNLDLVDSNRLNVNNNVGALDSIVNSDFHAKKS